MIREELIPYKEYEIAARYAKALHLLAREKKKIFDIETELKLFLSVLKKHKDLEKVLNHPTIGLKAKKKLLEVILNEGWMSEETRHFINLLIEKKRLGILNYIITVYQNFIFMLEKKVKVYVQSAQTLKGDQKKILKATLSKILGKDVNLTVQVNPSIIGGLRIKAGDTLYDGSVRRKLELLSKKL